MKSKKQSPVEPECIAMIRAGSGLAHGTPRYRPEDVLAIVRTHTNLHRILSFTHALNISIITINIQYHFRRGLVQARQVSLQSTTFQLTLWSPRLALSHSIPRSRGMMKVDEEVGNYGSVNEEVYWKDSPCFRLAAL